MAMVAFAATSNAQFWLGGGIGFDVETYETSSSSKVQSSSENTTFAFSPKLGVRIADRVDVGAKFTIATTKSIPDKKNNEDNWNQTTSWAISPFVRCGFASAGKLTLRGVAEVSVGQSIPETSYGKKTTTGDITTTVAFNLYPMLSYSLSDHFELEADLHFFGLSVSSSMTDDDDSNYNETRTRVGLTINNDNIATSSIMNIGFIFKF